MTWNTHKVTSPQSWAITTSLPIKADTHLEELVAKGTEKLSCASLNRTLSIWLVSFEQTQFRVHCCKEMNNLLVNSVPFKLLKF